MMRTVLLPLATLILAAFLHGSARAAPAGTDAPASPAPAVPAIGLAPTAVTATAAVGDAELDAAGPKRLMPYFEYGSPTPADRALMLECLQAASAWTDAAIIVVGPGHERTFGDLRRGLGERPFRIVPGLKVANVLEKRRFDDVTGWARVSREVANFAVAAQSQEVFLECEWALEPYWSNQVELNPAELTACINQLPPDLFYTFYPGGHGGLNQAAIRDNLGKAAVLWAAILDSRRRVRFTAATPTNYDQAAGWVLRGDFLLRHMSKIPPLESIYIGKDLNNREIGGFPLENFRTAATAKMRGREAYIWAADMLAVCRTGRE